MSQSTERPGAIEPGNVPDPVDAPSAAQPGAGEVDVSRQIAALTEAVNQLARLQQREPRSPQEPAPAPPFTNTEAGADGDGAADLRERYVREHLADLPEAYRRQMPRGGDEPQLAEAERTIRRQFREDLRVALGPAAMQDVGGDIPGGHGPAGGVDYARMSPVQQITLGLRDVTPVGPARAEVVRAPAPRNPAPEHARETGPAGAD